MKTSLVFANQGTIDFSEVRTNVIRIPEVVATLKEAQTSIDQICPNPVDLMALMMSDDSRFWANEKFRKICVSLVQIGLTRRYYKSKPQAKVLVATDDVYSPKHVLTGAMNLKEYVEACLFKQDDTAVFSLSSGVMPQKLKAYILGAEGYETSALESEKVEEIIVELRENEAVARFINVGPCNTLVSSRSDAVIFHDVQVEEMINMDPLLTWFWDALSGDLKQVAN